LKSPKHPQFSEVNAWYRGLQAAHVVKLCLVALDAGAKKLMMGWAVDLQTPLAVSAMATDGLYSATFNKLWPAAYTYDLLIRKLDGLKEVRRLPMPEGVYVYECRVQGDRRVLVAFYDDHRGQNHDEPLGKTKATIPVPGPRTQVSSVIAGIDQTAPEVRRFATPDGALSLTLTEFPVFLESNPVPAPPVK